MRSVERLRHPRWECKYHVVFIPKYRKKAIFGQIGHELCEVFRPLARQKESVIEEGHLLPDHVGHPRARTRQARVIGGRSLYGRGQDGRRCPANRVHVESAAQ
jgi:hypothetical protein